MTDTSPRSTPAFPPPEGQAIRPVQGGGWVLFAGIMVCLAGMLNVIYGIAAIADSSFFVDDARYILSGLNTWGWVTLAIGVAQLVAAYSIWAGGSYGRWLGIGVAMVSAVGALLALPAYPLWSLAVFTVDLLVIYGLATYGGDPRVAS